MKVSDEAIAGIRRELCDSENPYMRRLKPSVGEKHESAVCACIRGWDALVLQRPRVRWMCLWGQATTGVELASHRSMGQYSMLTARNRDMV